MQFHTEQSLKKLHPQLVGLLTNLRARRGFDAKTYIEVKTKIVNDYMRRFGLKSCVVAVSGGIDSAVVLGLVVNASKQKDSPIQKIVPIELPVFRGEYTTNQKDATNRGRAAAKKFGLENHAIDLTKAFEAIKASVDSSMGVTGEGWASGQLVSYTRTPAIYYTTSILTQLNLSGLVCGTTNRDEGAYLGYVGKASDGMVDIQVISDLHKSEVYKVAKALGVPKRILDATPAGDMYDGRVDEDVFGCGYDFVELFLLLRSLTENEKTIELSRLSPNAKKQYDILADRLEHLHKYNGHKYLASSPAIHLDALESGVPGGWPTGIEHVDTEPHGKESFVNAFELPKTIWPSFYKATQNVKVKKLPLAKGDGYRFSQILSAREREQLLRSANKHGWKPVGIDGYMSHYHTGDPIGSYRTSTFSPELAELIWKRLSSLIPQLRIMQDDTPTDWDGKRIWRAIGVSPLFRFIKYTEGGLLVPHYDAPYQYPDRHKTLMSLVLYIDTKGVTGGYTRFIKDPQINLPLAKKDYSDWKRFAKDKEVLFESNPTPGDAIAFDHRTLHDSLAVTGKGQKVILRTDIVYTSVPNVHNYE